jgi:hypothetical protein
MHAHVTQAPRLDDTQSKINIFITEKDTENGKLGT